MIKKTFCLFLTAILLPVILCSCGSVDTGQRQYGVFLGFTGDLDLLEEYETVVIDAQYYSADEISGFRDKGHTVYSYINVGSLENFRDYYDEFKNLAIGRYRHWKEEVWIDVSDKRWQDFIINELSAGLLDKGIDGFFADNCDVYYNYPTSENLDGLSKIMEALVKTGKKVLLNGGDVFLDAYCSGGGDWKNVITGINQETVFSKILWIGNLFSAAGKDDTRYFCDYIERYAARGADIYLLEYTKSRKVIEKIKTYCEEKGFFYYISDSVELDCSENSTHKTLSGGNHI